MKYLFLIVALPVLAQVESVKFRYGDDLRWADPNFDDSGWVRDNDSVDTRSWARYRVRVPDRLLDPVIGIDSSNMEVYVEGRLIGRHGKLPPEFEDSTLGYSTFGIPADLATPGRVLTVAIRMWDPPGSRFRGWIRPHELSIHFRVETPLRERESTEIRMMRGYLWSAVLMMLVLILLGVAGRAAGKSRELLLVAVFCAKYLLWNLVWVAGCILPWASAAYILTGLVSFIFLLTAMELTAVFAGVRPRWLRFAQFLYMLTSFPHYFAALYQDSPFWLGFAAPIYMWSGLMPMLSGVGVMLAQRTSGFSPRILPLVLTVSLGCVGLGRLLRSAGISTFVHIGDNGLPLALVGHLFFGVALLFGMLSRLKRSGAVALQLQGQMSAARSVHEMLLKGKQPATPGYVIDPVYQSAEDVGGDLFKILPTPEGETLLLVGDVSGKGLKAAMLVSVIVGALLNRRSSDPAEVLEELNRAIAGQLEGGFVTCCAVLLGQDGQMRIANAGHLAPYCGGVEVEVPAGLPLGVIREASYERASFQLKLEDQLTMLSDGVVEAENAQRELFGFERTRAISGKPAAEIAERAKTWGQNDDITVVTVRRVT